MAGFVSQHAGIDFSRHSKWSTSCHTCCSENFWQPWKFPPMTCQCLHIHVPRKVILSVPFSQVWCKYVLFDTTTSTLSDGTGVIDEGKVFFALSPKPWFLLRYLGSCIKCELEPTKFPIKNILFHGFLWAKFPRWIDTLMHFIPLRGTFASGFTIVTVKNDIGQKEPVQYLQYQYSTSQSKVLEVNGLRVDLARLRVTWISLLLSVSWIGGRRLLFARWDFARLD